MKYFFLAFSIFLLFINVCLSGQSAAVNRDAYRLNAIRAKGRIEVDGILDEAVWQNADRARQFHRIQPIDTGYARFAD